MRRDGNGIADARSHSPLAKYGKLDTCRNVMRAYVLYRYNLLKARYEQYGRQN